MGFIVHEAATFNEWFRLDGSDKAENVAISDLPWGYYIGCFNVKVDGVDPEDGYMVVGPFAEFGDIRDYLTNSDGIQPDGSSGIAPHETVFKIGLSQDDDTMRNLLPLD